MLSLCPMDPLPRHALTDQTTIQPGISCMIYLREVEQSNPRDPCKIFFFQKAEAKSGKGKASSCNSQLRSLSGWTGKQVSFRPEKVILSPRRAISKGIGNERSPLPTHQTLPLVWHLSFPFLWRPERHMARAGPGLWPSQAGGSI